MSTLFFPRESEEVGAAGKIKKQGGPIGLPCSYFTETTGAY